jgi:hypothetical protein
MGEADLGSDSGVQLRHVSLDGQGSVGVKLGSHSGLTWQRRGEEWVAEEEERGGVGGRGRGKGRSGWQRKRKGEEWVAEEGGGVGYDGC